MFIINRHKSLFRIILENNIFNSKLNVFYGFDISFFKRFNLGSYRKKDDVLIVAAKIIAVRRFFVQEK